MDISTEKYTSDRNRADPISAVMQTVLGVIKRITGFFMLTEEDRLEAGIHLGGEGRYG